MISYISPAMQLPRKMSAHNVIASISRTLGTLHGDEKPTNEVKFAGEESKDKLYEPKHKQKLVRVLTVVAYIISVSLAAIVLSLYYMYIWDPSDNQHYIAKQRINVSIASNAAKMVCPDISLTETDESKTSTANRLHETSWDKSKPLLETTRKFVQKSDNTNSQEYTVKNLFRTLTTPVSRRDSNEPGYTDLPKLLSISSDQFKTVRRINAENYPDSTINPEDDLLDD